MTKKATRGRPQRDEQILHNLLVRVARQYYLGKMTHQQIAEKEGVPRIKITRLLKEAEERRIVEFKIQDPLVNALELEEKMQSTFGLAHAIVAPTPASDEELYDVLGRFASDFLTRNLRNNISIGVGWGRTLNGMLPHLQRSSHANLRVVSLTGGLAANNRQPNPYDVASAVAKKLHARAFYPLLPAIVESTQARTLLFREKSMKDVMSLWKSLQIALVSIGVIATDTGVYYSFRDPNSEAERARRLGAVGDILATPFNIKGHFVDQGFSRRLIKIPFPYLTKIPIVAGVAGGRQKVPAILGALRSGYLNTLITDEETAKSVLSLQNKA